MREGCFKLKFIGEKEERVQGCGDVSLAASGGLCAVPGAQRDVSFLS